MNSSCLHVHGGLSMEAYIHLHYKLGRKQNPSKIAYFKDKYVTMKLEAKYKQIYAAFLIKSSYILKS